MTLLLYLCDFTQLSILSVLLFEAIFSERSPKLYASISRIDVRYFVQNHIRASHPKLSALANLVLRPLLRSVLTLIAADKDERAANKLTTFFARVMAV